MEDSHVVLARFFFLSPSPSRPFLHLVSRNTCLSFLCCHPALLWLINIPPIIISAYPWSERKALRVFFILPPILRAHRPLRQKRIQRWSSLPCFSFVLSAAVTCSLLIQLSLVMTVVRDLSPNESCATSASLVAVAASVTAFAFSTAQRRKSFWFPHASRSTRCTQISVDLLSACRCGSRVLSERGTAKHFARTATQHARQRHSNSITPRRRAKTTRPSRASRCRRVPEAWPSTNLCRVNKEHPGIPQLVRTKKGGEKKKRLADGYHRVGRRCER